MTRREVIKEQIIKRWNKYELDYLKANYPAQSVNYIANKLGRSYDSVQVKVSRMGLHKELTEVDRSYFDIINSSAKAYWLGFITADGYVTRQERSYELSIELSEIDVGHLIKFKDCILYSGKILSKTKSPFKGRATEYNMSQIRIYSKALVDALAKYGVIPNKTYSISWAQNVPTEYLPDYLRGYFDGDGTFSTSKALLSTGVIREYPRIGFVAKSLDFLKGLQHYLESNHITSHIYQDRGIYSLQIRKGAAVDRFFNIIYGQDVPAVCLDRKYNHYLSFFNLPKKLPA